MGNKTKELSTNCPNLKGVERRFRGKGRSLNCGIVQARLFVALSRVCRDQFSIASELSLASEPTSAPDISICNYSRLDWLHDEMQVEELPVAVVEILSPTQSVNETISKIET